MPEIVRPEQLVQVPRNLALIDTNVLVAYHDQRDNLHEQAEEFIEAGGDYILVVVPPVIVEACGLLTRNANRPTTQKMLDWLVTPGNVLLIPDLPAHADETIELSHKSSWMEKYKIDFVDVYLMRIADHLTRYFELTPAAPIITFDTRDFVRCALRGLDYCIYDMRTFDLVDFRRA
jgi:predicted nucleic acid-binding protein